ncbi:MAPEG family protein [Alcaligenes sp. Marseille-Q7550]
MLGIKIGFLVAAFLPWMAAICAKAGGKGFDNNNPRPWLAGLTGWRARANAGQANAFEALPFFYAAVLVSLWSGADVQRVESLMIAWLVLRVVYLLMYLSGKGTLRSLVWFLALAVNIWILFLPVLIT